MYDRNEEPRQKLQALKAERQAIIDRAALRDAKWLAHEARSTTAYFQKRRLYCMLQEEKALGKRVGALLNTEVGT